MTAANESKHRVLAALTSGNKTNIEIATRMQRLPGEVAVTAKRLAHDNFIVVLDSKSSTNKIVETYQITDAGREALKTGNIRSRVKA